MDKDYSGTVSYDNALLIEVIQVVNHIKYHQNLKEKVLLSITNRSTNNNN